MKLSDLHYDFLALASSLDDSVSKRAVVDTLGELIADIYESGIDDAWEDVEEW